MGSEEQLRSPNVTWQAGRLTLEDRWKALGAPGATVWLTGLPAAGKSTIGAAVEEALVRRGRVAYLLDGDNLRHGICSDLGFSPADRERNVTRVGELARLFAEAGAVCVVALISPQASVRARVRDCHERKSLPFYEVFIDTPLEVCMARDPKGLYARAKAGDIPDFTGVGQAYEPPQRPDLRLPAGTPVNEAAAAVLALLS